eukprot:TRINITY_DN13603_c1_g1_i3.p1 TRINITY_DN13603_c1_g1~~TRINITY_DN13603_c1_g1_i3.p1  ORF type:complete len:106 (+),score=2.51 TRINITY_DN13603_c1_g1_i3:112-429(+)
MRFQVFPIIYIALMSTLHCPKFVSDHFNLLCHFLHKIQIKQSALSDFLPIKRRSATICDILTMVFAEQTVTNGLIRQGTIELKSSMTSICLSDRLWLCLPELWHR